MQEKLDAGQKHLLRLVESGAVANGWAEVSKPVFPLMERLPSELVELEKVGDEGSGRARLTDKGLQLMDAFAWL